MTSNDNSDWAHETFDLFYVWSNDFCAEKPKCSNLRVIVSSAAPLDLNKKNIAMMMVSDVTKHEKSFNQTFHRHNYNDDDFHQLGGERRIAFTRNKSEKFGRISAKGCGG